MTNVTLNTKQDANWTTKRRVQSWEDPIEVAEVNLTYRTDNISTFMEFSLAIRQLFQLEAQQLKWISNSNSGLLERGTKGGKGQPANLIRQIVKNELSSARVGGVLELCKRWALKVVNNFTLFCWLISHSLKLLFYSLYLLFYTLLLLFYTLFLLLLLFLSWACRLGLICISGTQIKMWNVLDAYQ